MKLTGILPTEKWVEFEKDIVARYGVDANVFNVDGVRISEFKAWANDLCPAIRATDKGQSFICAVAHMNESCRPGHADPARRLWKNATPDW